MNTHNTSAPQWAVEAVKELWPSIRLPQDHDFVMAKAAIITRYAPKPMPDGWRPIDQPVASTDTPPPTFATCIRHTPEGMTRDGKLVPVTGAATGTATATGTPDGFPNIEAIANGRISGRFSEWPLVKPEAVRLLRELAEARARDAHNFAILQECHALFCTNEESHSLLPERSRQNGLAQMTTPNLGQIARETVEKLIPFGQLAEETPDDWRARAIPTLLNALRQVAPQPQPAGDCPPVSLTAISDIASQLDRRAEAYDHDAREIAWCNTRQSKERKKDAAILRNCADVLRRHTEINIAPIVTNASGGEAPATPCTPHFGLPFPTETKAGPAQGQGAASEKKDAVRAVDKNTVRLLLEETLRQETHLDASGRANLSDRIGCALAAYINRPEGMGLVPQPAKEEVRQAVEEAQSLGEEMEEAFRTLKDLPQRKYQRAAKLLIQLSAVAPYLAAPRPASSADIRQAIARVAPVGLTLTQQDVENIVAAVIDAAAGREAM